MTIRLLAWWQFGAVGCDVGQINKVTLWWCLQVSLCDIYLSALEAFVYFV